MTIKMINKTVKKRNNFIWNTLGSGLYSFTSLIYLIVVTRINGLEDAGIFTFAFSFACMMQVIGLYAGRTYQATEQNSRIKDCDYIYFKVTCCVAMIIISLIFTLIRSYDNYKICVIMLLVVYKCLDSFAEAIYGVFQFNNKLFQSGISLTLKSSLCSISFTLVDYISNNIVLSIWSVIGVDLIILCVYDIRKLHSYKIKWHKPNKKIIKFLLINGFFVFAFYFLNQYVVNAQRYLIDDCITSGMLKNSDQTIFGIILMPATFMALMTQFIFSPYTYDIKITLKSKNIKKFNQIIFKISTWLVLIGIIVVAISFFIGIPILNLLYNIDLNEYLWPLIIILFGSIFYAEYSVLAHALISIRKNSALIISLVLGSLISFVVSYWLINNYNLYGSFFAYTISMFAILIIYAICYAVTTSRIRAK